MNRGSAASINSPLTLLGICVLLHLLCVNVVSCRALIIDEGSYHIQDPWYDWPLEDTIEIIQRVKESKNHEMNSSRLFRSFDVFYHILPQNLDNFNILKKRYLEDIETNKYIQSSLLSPLNYEPTTYTQFRFTPPSLDFKEVALCVSVVKQIKMKNLLLEEVTLHGISSETPNFIAGSVANQVLQPGESITIDVLYFPRVMDHVEDYLTVQTSAGRYSFFVEGTGILNPYLLSPLIDKHIAADTSYAPSIEVFNPTSETLQIVGLFTTGGFLNLPYQGDTPIEFWQVNPYETRSIIRLNFLSPNPSSYRGTVNIATHDEFVITLPVEITVHQSEIICDPVEIDFGVHIHNKHTSTREISLLNAQTYPVLVTSVQIAKDDPQTTVNFAPLILPPGITTKVATVTHTSHTKGQFRGSLRIYTNDSNPHYAELQIPYYGTSIWGSIQYNPRDTSFLIKQFPTQETRIVPLVHHFPTPLVIYSAEVTSEAFRVVQCRSGDIMAYNTPWSGITVQFSGHTPKEPENMLAITTNLTTLYIPLVAYHGKLEYNVMEQIDSSKIDFGILALNEVAMRVVNVTNPNPVHIQINSIAISLPRLQVRLEGVYNAQGKRRDNSEFHGSHFTLESGHHALFILQIICTSEEMGMGFLTFQYNEKATLEIPVSYHSMKGTLNLLPGQLQFSPSFPGRILQKSISVKSTYSKPVYIQSVQSSDPRIIPITINATISPHVRMDIATVFFNPALGPPDENYMVSLSSQVLSPSPDDTYALQIDRRIINHRDNIWNRITADGSDSVQGTITINTDVTNGHTISFKAPLMRPSIITETAYDFDLTQIGSTSQMMVPVTNPSDQPLQVQLYSINPPSEFLLPPESDQPYFLPPRSSSSVGPIYFLPQYFHETNMSLYLKNNLTILEMLTIRGQGGSGLFVFADTNQTKQQRESNTPALLDALTFHLDASQMEQCLNETNPQLTITKNFIGMNKGNLPVQVYGLSINYGGCRDYGFRISPCIPFSLAPNEEILISVSFSPDFSSSVVKRSLIVSTSQGDISYPLEAEMPYDWLSVCADSQPLSPWQQAMRRCFIIASLFIFLLFLGYFLRENFFSSEAPSKVDSLTDVSIPVTAGATTHVHSMFPKITRNTSDCSHLLMIKKLEMPNEDHFARAIDDFVASLPPKKQKKKKKKLPTITPTKPPSQSQSTLKNSNSNSPKVTKPQPSEKPQTPHSASGDTKKQTTETKLSNSSPHSIPTSTENQLPPKSKEIATSPSSTNENTTVPVIQEPQQLPQLPPEVPIPQVAEKFTHTPPLSPTPSVRNPVPKNSPPEQSKPKVNQPTKEIQIPNRKVDTGIVKHQQTSPARFSPNTERRDRIEKKDVKQHRKEGERVVSPVRGAVPKGRKSNRDKRKPKKEKVWEPKKILTRPQTLQQQADLMGLHSPPFVQEEKKLEQDLAAILSDEPTPPGSPTPSHRPRTASLEWPWEQTFHSNLGVAMLRSDGDSLVDDHELENTSAGVIGQITPPRMPIGGAIGEGRGNSMVPSPALDSIFARNIFNQSESLFGNSHSDPDSPPSEDEQNSFSAVYQLF